DVGALEPLAVQPGGPGHDSSVRVAEDDPRPHGDELVDEKEPALEHLLEDQDRSVRLRGARERDRREVRRESGPDAALDLRNLAAEIVDDSQVLLRGDVHRAAVNVHADPELAERRDDRDEVVRLDVLDRHVSARYRGERREARDLDVFGPDAVLATREALDPLDGEPGRADAV